MDSTPKTPNIRTVSRLGIGMMYFFLPLAVFAIMSVKELASFFPYAALALLVALLVLFVLRRAPRHLTMGLWTTFALFLVGSTGWFFSPFFFALYLTAIGLGFLYTPKVAIAFTLSLILLFVPLLEATSDVPILLSLLSVIPIIVALRRSFLLVQQEKKGILILEQGKKASGVTTALDTVLANRINLISILLLQSITYIKQGLALMDDGKLTDAEEQELIKRMRRSSERLCTLVKQFERETTKNVIMTQEQEHLGADAAAGAARAEKEKTK